MKLLKVYLLENEHYLRLIGTVETAEGNSMELYFEYPSEFKDFVNISADPFFPLLLIPSMEKGEDIEIVPELSGKLYKGSETIQDIFTNWFPDTFQKIKVSHHGLSDKEPVSENAAQFFSLGVDSFYTLLKNHQNNLRYIIYMQGLELPLSRYSYNQEEGVLDAIRKVEEHFEVKLIRGKTNFRDYFDLDWPKYYHGAGLVSTALSLTGGFGKVYIPSSHSYGAHIPIGSSFMLDHHWSTGQLEIIHDGAEKGRGFKVADLVAYDSFALNNLRVCTENNGGNFNCCQCRKCISTMAVLDVIDKLEDSEAFPVKEIKSKLHRIQPYNLSSFALTKDLYTLAVRYKKHDIASCTEKELIIGYHDLYGRKELSTGIFRYIYEFISYLVLKLFRSFRI